MKKWIALGSLVIVLAAILTALFARNVQNGQRAEIDEWSSSLTADRVEWAEAAKGYGIEKCRYEIPEAEYGELVSVLKTVTEAAKPQNEETGWPNDYYLTVQQEQKLWSFQCLDNGCISVVFDSAETAAYYGYEDSALLINSPELWKYIVDTVDGKGRNE